MVNEELLQEYSYSIQRLKRQCTEKGMSEEEFKKLYYHSLAFIEMQNQSVVTSRQRVGKRYKLLLAAVIVICIVYNFKFIYSCVVCNLQDYIYPGLRLLRRISIPFISLFPSITDMDCWPCSTIHNIGEVHNPKPVNQQLTAPFIYESEQQVIKMKKLKDLYEKNRDIFDKESSKVLANNKHYISPMVMFSEQQEETKNLYTWKFNTMNTARLLRQLIPRPKVVPKFGQSTERFIIIDSKQDTFRIPDTECNFSFLLILSGNRQVHLVPAEECKHQCKSLKVDLKETYLLWYNWWYWRPVVQPAYGNETLIAHVGSYC
ncbi:uncharacterized protein LOC113523619 isoform X2 [Galleria mellonella]|uniref:Uncharacterized protein LOC113523619 isoform X2 n=1 Tax=Galleria mellonella TaxID=7137 RepID=A0A6J1X6W7_GALME|nr:uncharacterized protein LOC113523619 isoform X2 [Galleria mellonella]